MSKNRDDGWRPFMYCGSKAPFVMLSKTLLNTPAYKNLSPRAKELYTLLRMEYNPKVNDSRFDKVGVVICPYTKITEQGFRKESIPRYMIELQMFGFISLYKSGGLNNANQYHFEEGYKKITEAQAIRLKALAPKCTSYTQYEKQFKPVADEIKNT